MTISHDHIAQELYRERAVRLRDEVAAARLAKPISRWQRGSPVRHPWWYRLASGQRTVPETAS
jgi:hypothetical protein